MSHRALRRLPLTLMSLTVAIAAGCNALPGTLQGTTPQAPAADPAAGVPIGPAETVPVVIATAPLTTQAKPEKTAQPAAPGKATGGGGAATGGGGAATGGGASTGAPTSPATEVPVVVATESPATDATAAPTTTPATVTPTPAATATPLSPDAPLAIVGADASGSAAGYGAVRAVDGNAGTQWASAGASPWLMLSFNRPAAVSTLQLKTGPTPAGAQIVIELSDDGTTWTTALTTTNTTWNMESKTLPGNPTGRFVRLRYVQGTATNATFSVYEVTVQAAALSSVAVETDGRAAIVVYPSETLHPATSHILGTCRNHVTSDFPNGDAKVAKMRELTPTWGERKYLYRIGHGPTDGRNDYSYMTGFHFEQTWDKTGGYPYDDVRNGLREANAMGADQMHVVNFGTGDAAEAGRYVSFLNHAGDANRAAHPIAQQNVQMFELGNEISWSMVRGHDTYAPNETAYATRAKQFAVAMRAASDVPIQIGAVASTNSNWFGNGWSGGATSVKNILQTMGDQVDFLIFHGYPSWPVFKDGDLLTFMAQNEWSRQKLESEIKPAIRQYAGGRDVYLANTEFFSNLYNDPTRSRGMFGALYSADTLTLAMNEDIRTAVEFCFDHKEMADSAFFINNDPNNTTAIFKFQKMLAKHWGDNIVKTSASSIPSVPVVGASTSFQMPRLAFTAATSGSKVYVMVTNRTNDASVTADVNVGFTPSSATAYELSGTWDSANGTEAVITSPSLTGYTFKPASVTIFELTR